MATATSRLAKKTPASEEPGFSAKRFDDQRRRRGPPGYCRTTSVGSPTRATMNACRSWHCLHSNVRRSTPRAFIGSTSLIEVSPPHAGHSPSTPMGADWGACTLYPFALERSASPWESTSAARTSYDGVSIVPELAPVEQSSLCNIDHFPRQKTRPEPGFSCHFMGIPIRGEHHDASETDFPVPSVSAVTASAGWRACRVRRRR